MELTFSVIIFSIALLILATKKSGNRTTVKKLILGLVATLVMINAILLIIM